MKQDINTVELSAQEHSQITNINLYSGHAEITRLFKFEIQAGSNIVVITGLPCTFQQDSLRVEGKGNASIHDVTVEHTVPPQNSDDNSEQSRLVRECSNIETALQSARSSREALNKYLSTVHAEKVDIARLESTLDGYMMLGQKIGQKILDLKKELSVAQQELARVREADRKAPKVQPFSWKVSINVHGQLTETVRIFIKYVVYGADWTASYDIRVDTQTSEKNVFILYKAIVHQATGESWDNVPLTLETSSPSFGIKPPHLPTCRITAPRAIPYPVPGSGPPGFVPVIPDDCHYFMPPPPLAKSPSISTGSPRPSLPIPEPFQPVMTQPSMIHGSNKGNIIASFRIPGLINIPNDGGNHNVSVTQLDLDAAITWYAVPATDTRVHMKAEIRNVSQFTFVPGSANVYVDGSFIATTAIPSVSPQDTFDCPLGLDSTVRITYHPQERKAATSGFYSKTSSNTFVQRITVLNTKSIMIKNLKLIERIPVSEDERIEVKLLQPALALPTQSSKTSSSWQKPIKVSSSVVAQWNGVYEAGVDQESLGKDGKFNWVISVPPHKSVSLTLQYEVSHPKNLDLTWYTD
ncbi:Protein F37C4.5 [Psilocybe cubensis]|uniref:Mucoidy inhibitor A n=2 Tax=Psilocybe cubensis TaxID=181762 RepID=A0A8H8CNK2_PSICU|nr:Protein F37C4.5 [Psilocybe cubensis]KAH9484488.1 Protein F37C4.5 [Psilocybe cubensis]